MGNRFLAQIGSELVSKYKTRDPFTIAEALGIRVLFCEDFGPLKGMYRVVNRNRFIFINKELDGQMQRIVCAHELGHDQLHRHMANGRTLHEFTLYDMKNKSEYEANVIAADILLDDEDVLEYIYVYNYSAAEIAQLLGTDINLVALKVSELIRRGHCFHGITYNSGFLKA